MNWDGATAYVKWLSGRTGETYRLPSEAEWEYAARGGTTTMRHWGDDWDNKAGCAYANGASEEHRKTGFSCRDGNKFTSPVGRYRANDFGLKDSMGNVWEWAADCWNDNYANASNNSEARATGDCTDRVLCGGSWVSVPGVLRSADRDWYRTDIRSSDFGFRVARTLTC